MSGKVIINLDTDLYVAPTQSEISAAKRFVRQRTDNAVHLSELIDALLQQAAKSITLVCYKYNIAPEDFEYSANKDLKKEVYEILDNLEDEIYALIEEYSTNITKDKERKKALLAWLVLLKSKGFDDLRSSLHGKLMQFAYDLEAQIAAQKLVGNNSVTAVSRILTTLHSVYTAPEILAAFKKRSKAYYIQQKGVHEGGKGHSASGANNVMSFGRLTADMAWMHEKYTQLKDNEQIAGFYVLRGSNYPCDLCDSMVGFHYINEVEAFPPFHAYCKCYIVPIKGKSYEETIEQNLI